MFLGLDAERPFRVCGSVKRVAIKDTSITDYGAFNLMIHCDNLESLEYSQDSFLQQLLWRISQNYAVTKTSFNLKVAGKNICIFLKIFTSNISHRACSRL